MQNQQEHKAVSERVKVEPGPRPSDKSKPKKDPNSRSSKINDNAPKPSGKKRGLEYTESEIPSKRQKGHKEPVKEADEAGVSSAAGDVDSSMEEAGILLVMLSFFLCLFGIRKGLVKTCMHFIR